MKTYLLNKDVNVDCEETNTTNLSYDFVRYPNFIDLRDFCLPTDNQQNTPHCVGYTVGGFFEVHNWMQNHIPIQSNAEKIYKIGREYKCDAPIGTKLEYCLYSMKQKNIFDGEICFIEKDDDICKNIRCCIHQYGVIMTAFCITDEWYSLNSNYEIKEKRNNKILGGHCVLCCGYCPKGIYIQNSWGFEDWGNYGFAIVPWSIVKKQCNYCTYISDLKLKNVTEILIQHEKC